MKEKIEVYIIQEDGSPIFAYIKDDQGGKGIDQELLSGLISAIQSFINALGEKEAEAIELGKSKIFLSKDEETKVIFVLKCPVNLKNKKMFKILNIIKMEFIKNYKKFLTMAPNLRKHVLSAFNKDLNDLFGED